MWDVSAGLMTIDKRGAVGGVRIDRRKRGTRRKQVPVLLCVPQISNELLSKEDLSGRNPAL
jgi:hypothetical protein